MSDQPRLRAHPGLVAFFILVALLALGSVGAAAAGSELAAARAAHPMQVDEKTRDGTPLPQPPKDVLQVVKYPSPAGLLSAYLTPPPAAPGKHPAIIWLTGGDSNSLGDLWTPQPPDNDQSASAFRHAGIVTMFPSLRGGNDNPGFREILYGEVDDILAAADYLARQPYVDPARIYLGGHSTGGTLVLLVAECDARFRATFAFGPVLDIRVYGSILPVSISDGTQAKLRSPAYWLSSIRSPVFAFEGDHDGNTDHLRKFAAINDNPLAHFAVVPRASHFSVLAPATALIARKLLADTQGTSNIGFSEGELEGLIR